MYRRSFLLLPLAVVFGCRTEPAPPTSIVLATTTSLRDTGLLDELLPVFKAKTGIEVKAVAVGSGQAMALGRRGDADVLITHSPEAEEAFIAEGYGAERHPLMHNDFVLVGPADAAPLFSGLSEIAEAFRRIAKEQKTFVSRGDDSGTNQKEIAVWKTAGVSPQGAWYLRAGSGMGQTLRMANEKRAITLTDRGTYLSQKNNLQLAVLLEGDPILRNHYSIISLSPKKLPGVKAEQARQFIDFMLEPQTQWTIGQFKVAEFGQPLFVPAAKP